MIKMNIRIPDQVFMALNENEEDLSRQMKLYSAMELFKKHRLTLKQAADFAGYPLPAFMHELNTREIDIVDYDPGELERELEIFKEC